MCGEGTAGLWYQQPGTDSSTRHFLVGYKGLPVQAAWESALLGSLVLPLAGFSLGQIGELLALC